MSDNLYTKTTGSKLYKFPATHFSNIPVHSTVYIATYRIYANMYTEESIRAYACTYYGCTDDELENVIDEKKNKSKANSQKRQQTKNKRREKLEEALQAIGLTIRGDSDLCAKYINGTLRGWTLKGVVHECAKMRYFFDYCGMGNEIERIKDNRYNDGKRGHWYKYDDSPFDEAKDYMESKYPMPEVWPWLLPKIATPNIKIEPLTTNEPITTSEQPNTNVPLTTNEPLSSNEPLTTNEPITTSEQPNTNEPLTTNEPLSSNEPLTTNEPITTSEQPNTNEPLTTNDSP
ncbi:hypothetical protein PPL_02940 [Heterostelium album PN500]|uniref:Uncharacterized protein n=1 Tax=Heterostelium pallidum (strain ATCC 26659 / Pp 5 / PN500) TaxID=670386 RepID=D3B3H2_HETP5|nr:hypothetical protein PPL_02940 [Heterostelium album PN500]EFA83870.1 hypothetical protein PPL_02940 [Heterostelium album PN500]|eukprot:XP_020435987.1 hypothetical protein PPL_02940 [Heterostelium album PN500]